MDSLASRLLRLREYKGLSQEELALKANVTRQYISLLEKGQRTNPASLELMSMAKVLGTTMEYLLCGIEEKPDNNITSLINDLKEMKLSEKQINSIRDFIGYIKTKLN